MANIISTQERFATAGQLVVAEVPLSERLAFIRRVYSLLAISLVLGVAAGALTISNLAFLSFVASNIFLFFIAEFGVLIASNFVKRNGMAAFVMMNIFTILTGITTAPIVYLYIDVALQAALTTIGVFVGLTIYTFISKKDFSFLGGILTIALIAMIVIGLLNAFWLQSSATSMAMSWIGALVFSGFILFETSNIIRRYPTDMAVQAALGLYISILNLFIILLRIFGGNRN